jgi:glycosyltransferase involved in cell wall biosynthesis
VPKVSPAWPWGRTGNALLTARLTRRLRAADERGPLLQIGTLFDLPAEFGPHYVFTDMTIVQARAAGRFEVNRLSRGAADVALNLQHKVLHKAAHVFTMSEWAKRSVVGDFGVPEHNVTPIWVGANLAVPANLHETRRVREILFVGIDWDRKGGPLLLAAFELLLRRLPDATLRIIGCSPAVNHPSVRVDGFLDRRDPAQYEHLVRSYLRASCFCLPSLFEPFGQVYVEAASVGLPLVAIDMDSRREAVVDGVTGRLASIPTPEALADALYDVLRDEVRGREMGNAARTRASMRLRWDLVVDRLGVVIQQTPPGPRPRGLDRRPGSPEVVLA